MEKEITNSSLTRQAWLRYFARIIDMTIGVFIIGSILGVILGLTLGILGKSNEIILQIPGFILSTIVLVIYFLIEAKIISKYGTTPFKKLFGITLSHKNGNKLDYNKSVKRNFLLWFKGLALSIPLISFITLILAFERYRDQGMTSWDEKYDTVVAYKPISTIRFYLGVFIWIIAFALNVFMKIA